MPEVLTKHPTVVLDVLESAGARCGDGLPQKILTQCPPEAFCALPGGEMCVYGIAEVGSMTQIDDADLAPMICTQTAAGCSAAGVGGGALVGALMVGLIIGRRTRRRPPG